MDQERQHIRERSVELMDDVKVMDELLELVSKLEEIAGEAESA